MIGGLAVWWFFGWMSSHHRKILQSRHLAIIIFYLLLFAPISGSSQVDSIKAQFPFINFSANRIDSATYLQPFLRKLKQLKNGKTRQIRIAYIGDSHVQADYTSSSLRHLFQDRFGDAGRGLVFFYEQAGTHGPLDLQTESPQTWEARRRIFQKDGPAIGISGMGISCSDATFELRLSPKKENEPLHFNKVSLFHDTHSGYEFSYETFDTKTSIRQTPLQVNWRAYTVKTGDTLYRIAQLFNVSVENIRAWNHLSNNLIFPGQELSIQLFAKAESTAPKTLFLPTSHPQVSQTVLSENSAGILIRGERQSDAKAVQIYGALLEDEDSSGVLFNMMGVNGATYYHFNHAEHFMSQLAYLQPDLVIVTLGTNEAIQKRFYPDQFRKEVNNFLSSVRSLCPQASILLMTNPDVLVQRKTESPYTGPVREIIFECAARHQAAVWDLQTIMGGAGSVREWKRTELGYQDYIHFTKKGYILQARLLYDAIIQTYEAAMN